MGPRRTVQRTPWWPPLLRSLGDAIPTSVYVRERACRLLWPQSSRRVQPQHLGNGLSRTLTEELQPGELSE